jgi:hypothetical protein
VQVAPRRDAPACFYRSDAVVVRSSSNLSARMAASSIASKSSFDISRPHPLRGSEFSIGFQHCIDAALKGRPSWSSRYRRTPVRKAGATTTVAPTAGDAGGPSIFSDWLTERLGRPLPHCAGKADAAGQSSARMVSLNSSSTLNRRGRSSCLTAKSMTISSERRLASMPKRSGSSSGMPVSANDASFASRNRR